MTEPHELQAPIERQVLLNGDPQVIDEGVVVVRTKQIGALAKVEQSVGKVLGIPTQQHRHGLQV